MRVPSVAPTVTRVAVCFPPVATSTVASAPVPWTAEAGTSTASSTCDVTMVTCADAPACRDDVSPETDRVTG